MLKQIPDLVRGGVLDKVIPSFDYLVYLFMIISGFGMCNGYYQKLKTGTYSIDAFYSKRYKRTVPFFALLILLNCVIEFTPKTVCEGLMEITMLFGFLPNNTLSTIGVAWTLGAIFAFYIIFPFIVFLLYSPKRGIVSFVISLVITYMCQCYFMTERFVTENFVMRHSFLYCLPYFLIGGIVYLYKDEIERFVNIYGDWFRSDDYDVRDCVCFVGCWIWGICQLRYRKIGFYAKPAFNPYSSNNIDHLEL